MRMACIAGFLLAADVLHGGVDTMELYYNVRDHIEISYGC